MVEMPRCAVKVSMLMMCLHVLPRLKVDHGGGIIIGYRVSGTDFRAE